MPPSNPIHELADALRSVADGYPAEVWWHLEPAGYFFSFEPRGDEITLTVLSSEDSEIEGRREIVVHSGGRAEVLLPFWQALRQFESFQVDEPHWPPLEDLDWKEFGELLRS